MELLRAPVVRSTGPLHQFPPTMAYLVLAYPELAPHDLQWIQEYRELHDPQFSLLGPHFTLVFAVDDLDEDDFRAEVKLRARGIKPLEFVLATAAVSPDDSSAYCHEVLIPTPGDLEILKLHDQLYSGLFTAHRRDDLTFIPHVTIGRSESIQRSQERVDALNRHGMAIRGQVQSIDVIEHADGAIRSLERLQLQS